MSSAYPNPQEKLENSQIFLRWWPQLTALLLVFVELMWILPWFKILTQITTTAKWWTAGLILGGIMLSAYAIGYLMESLRLIKNIQLVVMAGFLLLGLTAAENMLLKQPFESVPGGLMKLDPGAILVLFFVIWMWWRGLSLSKGDIRPMVAWRRFELGLLLFMGYILIAARTGFILPGMEVFFLFLFSGLLAGIFARISYVAIVKGIQKNPFDLRWSISVTAILGITVSTAVMIGGILGGQYRMVLDYLGEGLKLAIAAAIFLVGIPGLLITYFLSPIIPWFRSLFAERPNISTPDPASEALRRMIPWQDEVPNLSLNLQAVCFWGLVLFALVFLIFRLRRRLGANRLFDPGEPESLLKQGEARKLLVKSLQDGMMGLMIRFKPARRVVATARIRRIYSELLSLCNDLGQPRRPHQTPLEFMPEMGELFSNLVSELGIITQAYQRARYGEYPEDQIEMEAIEEGWRKIDEEGQRLRRAGRRKLKTAEVKEIERSGV